MAFSPSSAANPDYAARESQRDACSSQPKRRNFVRPQALSAAKRLAGVAQYPHFLNEPTASTPAALTVSSIVLGSQVSAMLMTVIAPTFSPPKR